jgi:PKD repeat protein
MRREITRRAVLAIALVAACSATVASPALGAGRGFRPGLFAPSGAHLPFAGGQHAVCGAATPGAAACLSHVLQPTTSSAGPATVVSSPTGLAPNTIDGVYGFAGSAAVGTGETVALVDAYNDPNASSDLATFDAKYGLPGPPSFSQVSQTGTSSLPATNASWDLEISLDIEWAHAMAPGAKILLVEATSNSLANLLAAERYASAHAQFVSNSWGSSEFSGETSDDTYFETPGVEFFAAAGDSASELLWPSTSPHVLSIGGTSLTLTSGNTLAQEPAWSDGGGGCSGYETASPQQVTGSVNCGGKRATPDISLDADPNSGVSVYDSVTYDSQSGWWTVGGTSASTAMIAGEAAANASTTLNAATIYASAPSIELRDIISGSNGHPAVTGYDLATGLGSWSNTPGAAVGLTATGEGSNGITLAWRAPTGAPVTQYVIWRGTASGQETTDLATVSASGGPSYTYTDASATGATSYYYEVQAINALGNAPFSTEAHAQATATGTPPVAHFTTSCSKATCHFTSTSTGTISSYAWNGGNGTTGTSSTFSDTYASAGAYTASLTVGGTAGQSSASTQITCKSERSRFTSSLTCT